MSIFDQLFGRRTQPDDSSRRATPRDPSGFADGTPSSDQGTDEQAVERYRYLLRTAPLEAIDGVLHQRPSTVVVASRGIQHALGQIGGGPQRLRTDQLLNLTQGRDAELTILARDWLVEHPEHRTASNWAEPDTPLAA